MRTTEILDYIESLPLKKLNEEFSLEEEKAKNIQEQLTLARANKKLYDTKADPVWYSKTCSALKLSKFKLALMNRQREQLKKEGSNSKEFSVHFMTVAKRLLKDDVYTRLVEETKEEAI